MSHKWIIMPLLCLMLFGCASYQSNLKEMAVVNLQNAEAFRAFSDSWSKTWLLNSCFVKAGMGKAAWSQLPKDVTDAWDENDRLATKLEPLTDCEKSIIVGNTLLIGSKTTLAIIAQFAPQVIKYIPTLAGLN